MEFIFSSIIWESEHIHTSEWMNEMISPWYAIFDFGRLSLPFLSASSFPPI